MFEVSVALVVVFLACFMSLACLCLLCAFRCV